MNKHKREVWITGIGLVSSFGEGAEHHWQIMGGDEAPTPVRDLENFAPYCVHPLPEMDWSQQIPRRGDQRQMENWQRLGTYAAGLALDDAGVKDNEEIVSSMDLVVAAGGGERDMDTDNSIMAEAATRNDHDNLLVERLPSDLRPTLFLAQLSNLLAGNISIVHKVTGSSRTYMGEENAGVTAIENAVARVASGSSTHALVGGAYNAERLDLLLIHELGHYSSRGPHEAVIKRQETGGGIIAGTVGAFLMIEDSEHAKARGAVPYAKISGVASDLGERTEEKTRTRVNSMIDKIVEPESDVDCVLSGSSGAGDITTQELDILRNRFSNDTAIRVFTSMIGHPVEANFPAGIALAALSLKNGKTYPKFENAETQGNKDPESILVTTFSHWRGEGIGLVEKI